MRRRRRGRCRRFAPPPLIERPPHVQSQNSRRNPMKPDRAAARVTEARRVPGRAGSGAGQERRRSAAVIHGGTTRRHVRQLPSQTLTQVVNRHDRPSPSFGRASVEEAATHARGCTRLRVLAVPRGGRRDRPTDTLRHRTRRTRRTRTGTCLVLKCDLQVRCAVLDRGEEGTEGTERTEKGFTQRNGETEERTERRSFSKTVRSGPCLENPPFVLRCSVPPVKLFSVLSVPSVPSAPRRSELRP